MNKYERVVAKWRGQIKRNENPRHGTKEGHQKETELCCLQVLKAEAAAKKEGMRA